MVSLYESDSRVDNAVTGWLGEDLAFQSRQQNGSNGATNTRNRPSPDGNNQNGQSQIGLSQATIMRAAYCILGVGTCMEGTTCKPLARELADIVVGVILNAAVGICGKA